MLRRKLWIVWLATCLTAVSCRSKSTFQDPMKDGQSNFEAKNYAAALTNFSKALEINPTNAEAFCLRGMSKWWLSDFTSAVADYDKAIALKPDCARFYCNRGEAKFYLHDCNEALADYNKSIELDPTGAEPYFNRGSLKLLCFTNCSEAIADYTRAIDLQSDPHPEDIFFMRGCARHQLNDFDGAIADYKRALSLNPTAEWANSKRCQEYLEAAERSTRPPWDPSAAAPVR